MSNSHNPDQIIRPEILALSAYHVPPATGMIKLDAMENPYAWPEELKAEWHAVLDAIALNRYPDPEASQLKDSLRKVMVVPAEAEIMLGNGSDELIQILAMAMAGPGRHFLAPEPGFVMYRQITQALNAGFCGVPLKPTDFSLDEAAMLAAIEKYQPALIFIAFPNNPTGNLFERKALLEVIRRTPGLVIIDEAYHAFSGQSFLPDIGEFENLLIMRTLSKSGLAGIRLGYLLGPVAVLEELEKIRLPYNINALTQATAEFMLTHYNILEEQACSICASRENLYAQLLRLHDIKAWPSAANFILFRCGNRTADEILAGLRQQGILIKNMHGSHPLLKNCLRVTVGAEAENQAFLAALQRLV